MAKYAVKITEKLQRTIIVDAENFSVAVEKVTTAYNNQEISLDCENIDQTEIRVSDTFGTKPIDENDERLKYYTSI